MAREYIVRTKEEKLAIVKRNLAGETCRALAREIGCNQSQVLRWTKKYLAEGAAGFEPKKRPGDPLSRYRQRKNLTYEEELQSQAPQKRGTLSFGVRGSSCQNYKD